MAAVYREVQLLESSSESPRISKSESTVNSDTFSFGDIISIAEYDNRSRSIVTWRYGADLLEIQQISSCLDFKNFKTQIKCPFELKKRSVHIFYDRHEQGLAICIASGAGAVFRLKSGIQDVDIFSEDTDEFFTKKGSLLSSLLVESNASEPIELNDLRNVEKFQVIRMSDATLFEWIDRESLVIADSNAQMQRVQLPRAGLHKVCVDPFIHPQRNSRITKLISSAMPMYSASPLKTFAISSPRGCRNGLVFSLDDDWKIRAWSFQSRTCLSHMDLHGLLQLNPAQLTASERRLAVWDAGDGTSLSRASADPLDESDAYFIASLHCKGSMLDFPTHHLVQFDFKSKQFRVGDDLLYPSEDAALLSVDVDASTNSVWAFWSTGGGRLDTAATRAIVLHQYDLARLSMKSQSIDEIRDKLKEHQMKENWQQFENESDIEIQKSIERSHGWKNFLNESLKGISADLHELQLRVERYYLSRLAVKNRFSPHTLRRALETFVAERKECKVNFADALSEVLFTMRNYLSFPCHILREVLEAGNSMISAAEIDAAVGQISSSWYKLLSLCMQLTTIGSRPLAIAPIEMNDGCDFEGVTLILRQNGVAALVPSSLRANNSPHALPLSCASRLAEITAPHASFDFGLSFQIEKSLGGMYWILDTVGEDSLGEWVRNKFADAISAVDMKAAEFSDLNELIFQCTSNIELIEAYMKSLHPREHARYLDSLGMSELVMTESDLNVEGSHFSSPFVSLLAQTAACEIQQMYVRARNASLMFMHILKNMCDKYDLSVIQYIHQKALPAAQNLTIWLSMLVALSNQRVMHISSSNVVPDIFDQRDLSVPQNYSISNSYASDSVIEALVHVFVLRIPQASVSIFTSSVLALFWSTFADKSDVDACLRPINKLTTLEWYLYKTKQSKLLPSLLSIYQRTLDPLGRVEVDLEDRLELNRFRCELAGECFLAEATSYVDGGNMILAKKFFDLSLQMFKRSLPSLDTEPGLIFKIPKPDLIELRLERCLHQASLQRNDLLSAAAASKLREASSALHSIPPPARRLLRPLLDYVPLFPFWKILLASDDTGHLADELLRLSQSENLADTLARYRRISHVTRALRTLEPVVFEGYAPILVVPLIDMGIESLPAAGLPARVLIESEVSYLYSMKFSMALYSGNYDDAVAALSQNPKKDRRQSHVFELVEELCTKQHYQYICSLKDCEVNDSSSNSIPWSLTAGIEMALQEGVARVGASELDNNEGDRSTLRYYECLHCFYLSKKMYKKAGQRQYDLSRLISSKPLGQMTLYDSTKQDEALMLAYNSLQLSPPNDQFVVVGDSTDVLCLKDLYRESLLVHARVELTQCRLKVGDDPQKVAVLPIATPEGAVKEYAHYGYVEAAVDFITSYWSKEERCYTEHLTTVVALLVGLTCSLESEATLSKLSDPITSECSLELPPSEPFNTDSHPCSSTQKCWTLLREILQKFECPASNFALHEQALSCTLVSFPKVRVPDWLYASYEEKCGLQLEFPGSDMMESDHHVEEVMRFPSSMLKVLLQNGQLIKACEILIHSFNIGRLVVEKLLANKGLIPIPFDTIECLFQACEWTLDGGTSAAIDVRELGSAYAKAKDALNSFVAFTNSAALISTTLSKVD